MKQLKVLLLFSFCPCFAHIVVATARDQSRAQIEVQRLTTSVHALHRLVRWQEEIRAQRGQVKQLKGLMHSLANGTGDPKKQQLELICLLFGPCCACFVQAGAAAGGDQSTAWTDEAAEGPHAWLGQRDR